MRLLIILTVTLFSGCSYFGKHAGPFVNSYCEEPLTERIAIREAVAAEIAPNRIHIICEGD
jgi:hypothetical protein